MVKNKKIMFGLVPSLDRNPSFLKIKNEALECEKLGYSTMWFTDHLLSVFGSPDLPIYECWTTLAAIAAVTKNLRIGTLVLCNSYREPSVLAKMAATLDNISNGRLDFGIGAGWYSEEYKAYNFPFEKASVRIAKLREAAQVIKCMWTEKNPQFDGKYYKINDAFCNPKPIQKPHPPIWIGGGGEKLTLKVIAELADGCNPASWVGTPEDFEHKINVLEKHCSSIGRDPDLIQKSWAGSILIAKTEQELNKRIEKYVQMRMRGLARAKKMGFADYNLKPSLFGTPEQCIEKIEEYRKAGATQFMFNFPKEQIIKDLRLFSKKVITYFN
jgi:F420-dependent oxidoreductase-like protein